MTDTATVETLTAEVRTLMVGNRQVTMSVYKQLDCVGHAVIEPFGRVQSGAKYTDHGFDSTMDTIEVVGLVAQGFRNAGTLVRAWVDADAYYPNNEARQREERAIAEEWSNLPLIVLAGLR
jgi:hypothetical protein